MSCCQNGSVLVAQLCARIKYRHAGKLCIEVKPTDKIAFISEFLCIGCGICVKKYVFGARLPVRFALAMRSRCPFEAISIINLPTNLASAVTHRYTANSFKLHRLPTPRPGQVLGLVGTNGIGKSTALKVLAGKLKPNLGRYDVCSNLRRSSAFRSSFTLVGPTRLARDLKIFPRIGTTKLLHEGP
jgi:translation initiation factor RLI1